MSIEAQRTRLFHDIGWGGIRLVVVVVGGLLVLQSSDELDPSKLVYLAAAVAALAGALHNLVAGAARQLARRYQDVLVLSGFLFGLLAASLILAHLNGTPSVDSFRDVVTYGLFAAVPIFALDAAASSSRRFLTLFLVGVGVLASLSTAIEWIGRRDIADLPIERLLMPGGQLAVALYALALAAAFTRRRPIVWSATAGVLFGLSLVTGTRSSLLVLAMPVAMAVVMRPRDTPHALRVFGIHLVIALVVFTALGLALQSPPSSPDLQTPSQSESTTPSASSTQAGSSRPAAPRGDAPTGAERLLEIGRLAQDPAGDASVRERVAQYQAAWELFLSSPAMGVGPGHPIKWIDVSNQPRDDFTADTPLVLPAKFGLVGTALVGLVVLAYFRMGAALVERGGWRAETLALFAYGVFGIITIPLSMPIEGKAFSFGLALLLALALVRRPSDRTDSRAFATAAASTADA